jgi:hypothetical protein
MLLGETWVFNLSGFGVIRQNICDLQWMEAFIPEAVHVREVGGNDSTPAEYERLCRDTQRSRDPVAATLG